MPKNRLSRDSRQSNGFVIMELIIYLVMAGIVLGGLFLVMYPAIRSNINTNEIKSQYSVITQGLSQYYSNNYQYPKATSWSWDSANTYINPAVKAKGWKYTCSGTTISLTTPTVGQKTLQRLDQTFSKTASSVKVNSNTLKISLDNKPCP